MMMKRNTIFSATLALTLTLFSCGSVIGAAIPSAADAGSPVAVCTVPACLRDLKTISNLARGITFSTCADKNHPAPAGTTYASVSITKESGFQSQFWDAGTKLDTYWLYQYLNPLLTCQKGFKSDCWEAPAAGQGCAKPPTAAAVAAAAPAPKRRAVARWALASEGGVGAGRSIRSASVMAGGGESTVEKKKPKVGTRDVDLVPLGDPSLIV
ncbi:uncharacterized protein UTRI_00893_B [Ustilago trichophora]|uniref:Uncharacterized protein n=1 Tax=Ustilago trichophora TaxID=86804 RepID=A0A5C3DTK8_9BASI|nr:uncharacterized protein UTRI_00893_B [Ustilago trichophora]